MTKRSVRLTIAASTGAVALLLAGCGSDTAEDTGSDPVATDTAAADDTEDAEDGDGDADDDDADDGDDADSGATITIADFAYGDPLTVAPGETITVINEDSAQHDVDAIDGESFETDLLGQGESLTFTAPMEPGSYEFTCSVHPQMLGTLIVEE
ncbi:hypothetical protein BH20ACT5_BH20ACT5_16760 [soil metagenome]